MRIAIKETRVQLSPLEARYLARKLAAVEKLVHADDELAAADVEIERTTRHHRRGDVFRAEINLRAALGSFRAEAFAETTPAAIDGMKDEIVRQLTERKDKSRALAREGALALKRRSRSE
jgi:ribosomal subunit interface protein